MGYLITCGSWEALTMLPISLRQLYEDVGGFGVLLAMGHEWDPKEKWLNVHDFTD